MISYIGKRMIAIIPIVFVATLVTFALIHISPVDPAEAYLTAAHIYPTPELLEQKRHEFGLDRPLFTQYIDTLGKISRMDFGTSYLTNKPVIDEVKSKLPATAELALWSILFSALVSIPLGILAAVYKNSWIDMVSRGISYFGASIPQFWLGYLLIFFFSVKLDWLPVEGRGSWENLVLPTVTLSLILIALYTRLLRSSVLEQLQETYVQYARTRGIRERVIMLKHVLKIAISPLITGMGMSMGKLLTGTIIVEQVFSWPGFGRYFVDAIFNRDIPVIQCYVFLAACLFIVCNLLVDLVQLAMDPRISAKGRAEH
ncbi:nickel ABC transporter permease subunit NikB [Paenibacillus sp. UMB7766-LJ446]|uniref:nickel ABC transporter permease subunit NikB n=1 Tax=unclassified Paenibacillus TaxID=185978 RepID=UPI0009A2EF57|nr:MULTISPECIES: nickel ABC transporter permease subunit NikB [unclassified Paenibacillus]EAA9756072.1 nickel ABC transporter permease subunit NikB [Salmonella enterica]OPG97318.1 nickel ABC transporter permease subunit NikB [Chryseobacterium mucoviscidosis]EAQ6392970.1 nickel ABC transporter permease subunit NikB [Salmonella enterica]MDK8190358.1 nickel ABC transporter permease subunit NikB [Paenibacillus sp. UMB7766-LJ446]MDN8591197.1 nickel ABC transporter permease subunit NikB [Paenibacill